MKALSRMLSQARRRGVFPAAQAAVIVHGKTVHTSAHGPEFPGGPPVEGFTRFDVASVTKVLSTTACVMRLVDDGQLDLDQPIGRWLPAAAAAQVTPRELLAHRSGLPAWGTFFVGPEGVMDQVLATPAGEVRRVYSDVGFLLLGALIAAIAKQPLQDFAQEQVFARLDLYDTGYVPLGTAGEDPFVVTGDTRPRHPAPGQEPLYTVPDQAPVLKPGEVDDDNAWALGGVAGHAGVFSTATDVAAFGLALLQDLQGAHRLAAPHVIRSFVAPDRPELAPVRSLGFDRPSGKTSSIGTILGRGHQGAIGHLGFTGCSLWVDLDAELSVALLTNRVLPTRANVQIKRFRPTFHDAVALELDLHRSR
jgi:CubicO group peptidase (beta-lactamase class C family)